jgi:hypothetical protein
MLSIETLLVIHIVSLLIEGNIYSRLNIKYNSSAWACTILIFATLFLFHFMRVTIIDLALVLTLRRL